MVTHALIKVSTVEDTGKRHDYGVSTPPDVSRKDRKWVVFTARGARPAYDPATHHAPQTGPDTVSLTEVTQTWAAAVALTAQEITDRENDVYAQTNNKLDAAYYEDPLSVEIRGIIELFNKRDNYLVNRILELQAALDAVKASSGPADNIRAAVPASWLATATRSKGAAIQDLKDDIAAGNQNS